MNSKSILFEQMPHIARARDFRLYAANGKRYVDLWQAGGAAVLGHNPSGVLRELKNTAERGLFAPLPNHLEARFLKALAKLLPGYSFYVYADEHSLYRALGGAGFSGKIVDPALHEQEEEKTVSLWRPFVPMDTSAYTLLIPVLPWYLSPKALAIKTGAFPTGDSPPARRPFSDAIPPVILAAAARALYDLLAEMEQGSRAAPDFPKLAKALKASGWRRKGIYIHYDGYMDTAGYSALFYRFLEAGFVLPPDPEQPAILPPVLSTGEEAKLAALIGE
ncbi:MAG: hypothetical protein LBB61_08635 [Treponema sp.]|jgi:hypothetical protein|nr:hypothetical protein [Treponema sp.]